MVPSHAWRVTKKLAMPDRRHHEPLPTSSAFDILRNTNQLIQSMTLAQRKKVMTGLRVGVEPKYSRRQIGKESRSKQRRDLVTPLDANGQPLQKITMEDVWYTISPLLSTPVQRSILSVALRSGHLLEGEGDLAIEQGIVKELSVTQRDDLSPTVHYPFFISREACLSEAMHPDIPHRPVQLLILRQKFIRLQHELSQLILIPRVTTKTCGIESSEAFWTTVYPHLASWERPVSAITTAHLERLWMEEELEVDGPCEVRVAWKFNDLKPRIYYAIGASAYNHAKYLHTVFDRLCKMSRSTHPSHRYTFAGFPQLSFPEDTFIIYDYASFTSRLVDFKKFIAEWAYFMRGTQVQVFDTRYGIQWDDLGRLLNNYNDVCNIAGEFSISRIASPGVERPPVVILEHKVAGMLGVFGNIVGSTALHGIVGVQICGSDQNGNFIGDDAGIVLKEMDDFDVAHVKEAIRSIGEIADEKFEIFEENDETYELSDSWHYVKRPVCVSNGGIKQTWMPEFPLIAPARGIKPNHITVALDSIEIRRRVFVRQVTRFLNSLYSHRSQVTDEDWDLCQFILSDCYRRLELPISGAVPRLENRWITGRPHGDDQVIVPPIRKEVIEIGWRESIRRTVMPDQGTIRIPKFAESSDLPAVLTEGLVFVYQSDRVLSLLAKIGVIEKKMLVETRLLTEDSLEDYFLYIDGKLKPLYEYQVLVDYPQWSSYYNLL